MWRWIRNNAEGVEALAAVATAVLALVAVIGVKWQIDASDRIQREQAAREIYREFLSLSVQQSKVAAASYCALSAKPDRAAYEHYIEYMLYTAEQVIEADPDWRKAMLDTMSPHEAYFCSRDEWTTYSAEVQALISQTRKSSCEQVVTCPWPHEASQ